MSVKGGPCSWGMRSNYWINLSSTGPIFTREVYEVTTRPEDGLTHGGIWYFIWSEPEQTVKQTIKTQVTWDAKVRIMTLLQAWQVIYFRSNITLVMRNPT